ncbi:DUF481 domain-containing protein [Halorhodospira halochloris]|uniref:DUF481 domain-containing protein n=1 Tax=Halorhodospira halochloris TaxID=1052 RepID=UPI001EE969F4|nr:DUF481 domain-containing protein [Halorhodospira halochloris]MCG5531432.1 DUF481 domain-containing protein [Halorhodospira halochloris]
MRTHNKTLAPLMAAFLLSSPIAVVAEDDSSLEATATLGASINRGNTDSERYSLTFDYLQRTREHRFTFDAEANRGESDGEEDVNNTRAASGYDWFFHGPWYANTSLSWRQDRMRDLYSRYSFGAGAGYQFFDDDQIRLSVEFGPSYIYEIEEKIDDRESSDQGAARWALDYRQYVWEDSVRIFHRHEFVMMADDSDNWYATTRTGVRMPVRENLSASLQFNYDYDNKTTADHRYDSTTLVTLTYDWE